MIAKTPTPPYYAVIFTSVRTNIDDGYEEMSNLLVKLAGTYDGFLGIESARNEIGISVSYWKDLESIKKWKQNTKHIIAQKLGKEKWYSAFKTRIAIVNKDFEF